MKKRFIAIFLWIIGSIALMAVAYYVLLEIHPKNARRVPLYLVLFYLDLYLWISIWRSIRKEPILTRTFSFIFYWLPMAGAVIIAVVSFKLPNYLWGDFWRIYPGGIIFSVYMAKMISVVFLIISHFLDFIHFAGGYFKFKPSDNRKGLLIKFSHQLIKIGWATGFVFFVLLMLGIFVFSGNFEVNKQQVFIKELPEEFDGYRIVQISDLHLGSWISKNKLQKAVNLINDLEPDIFVFTGDLVNYAAVEAEKYADILSKIQSKSGNYCILGNHDYGEYVKWRNPEEKARNMEQFYDVTKMIGWKLLLNESVILKQNNDSILIIGVENWGRLSRFPKRANIDSAISGRETITTKILFSHDPTHWEDVVTQKYPDIDLTLSGHVHGFQIGLKVGKWEFSPAQFTYKYWDGFYEYQQENGMKQYLYVNRGLGSLLYPGRLGMNPEITLIELRKQ